jgi:hypothetical protein
VTFKSPTKNNVFADYFLKIHLNHSSLIKRIHKTKKLRFLILSLLHDGRIRVLLDGRRIRILLDDGRIRIGNRPKMLDLNPYQMNTDPQHF